MVLLLFSSCKKSDDIAVNCEELGNAFINTYQEYLMNPTQENCEAFIQAAEDYLNGCATTLTPAQRQEYQDAIDNVDCSN